MALRDEEIPLELRQVRDWIAQAWCDGDPERIFVNSHEHEGLPPGAYSIALEGGSYEWPLEYLELRYQGQAPRPGRWFLEAKNEWCLAAYPSHWDDDYIWGRPARLG